MTQLVNSGSGNFTTAATWNTVDTTSFLNSEVGTTTSPIAFTNSSSFTPGAITVDGVGLKISSRTVGSAATFSVRLATGGGAAGTTTGTAVAGTTVTINVSDLVVTSSGWYFFKFAAPVTLAAATAHSVQVVSSIVGHVTIFRDATSSNWSRLIRTTTTQAPVAADDMIVVGDMLAPGSSTIQTVTMNNTAATSFGKMELGGKGILNYGTTAATTYQLRIAGNLDIGAGTLQIGTSGTPIPSTSSAALEFIVAANVQFGLRLRGDGVLTTFGTTKTGRAYLASDAAATATSLTSDVSTGWSTGDLVVLASTTRTMAETELLTLSANAVGTTLSTSALSFAHSGTNPTRAELANLTRNVKIFGQSVTLQTFIIVSNTAHTLSMNYTELFFMGSAVANTRGIDINTVSGTFSMLGCVIRNFEVTSSIGINIAQTTATNISITDCVFYRCALAAISTGNTTSPTITLTNCWGFSNVTAATSIFLIGMNSGTINGLTAVSCPGTGNGMSFSPNDALATLSISNLTAHSNGSSGVIFTASTSLETIKPIILNTIVWRNVSRGLNLTNTIGYMFDGVTSFGNAVAGIVLVGSTLLADVFFKNMTVNAGTTLTQPIGLELNGNCTGVIIEDSTFGATTTHATGDTSVSGVRSYIQAYYRNCLFASATALANQTINLLPDTFIGSASHNQVSGASLAWTKSGIITKDTAIYDTTSIGTASTRLTPSSATIKLKSPNKNVIVPMGKSIIISAKVRWSSTIFGDSANYNGSNTRLWVRKNPAVGINSDTVLFTLSTSPDNPFGRFVRIAATTAAATDSGVLSFYIDCDGTTGWINIDTWQVEIV